MHAFCFHHLLFHPVFYLSVSASPGDYITPHMGGRTILSYESDVQEDGFKVYTGVIVNCIIYMLFFAWLLIKGEPRYSAESKNIASFRMYMEKADAEMAKVCKAQTVFSHVHGYTLTSTHMYLRKVVVKHWVGFIINIIFPVLPVLHLF